MIETKDKAITVESLSVLHEHDKKTYMQTVNPSGSGTMTIDNINAKLIKLGAGVNLIPTEDYLEIRFSN